MATATRGCGVRSPAGIYIVTKLSRYGRPLHEFLVDPARPVPEGLDVPNRGQYIAPRFLNGKSTGIYDVYDRIGTSGYPNVQDFIAEVGKMGASRRVSPTTDFSLLTPQSKLVLIHEKAIVENAVNLYQALDQEREEYPKQHSWYCPCGKEEHAILPEASQHLPLWERHMPTCVGCYVQTVQGGEVVLDPDLPPRTVERTIGSTTYRARKTPEGFVPTFSPGIFMILPINLIEVIKDPEGGKDLESFERAGQSYLPVELTDD